MHFVLLPVPTFMENQDCFCFKKKKNHLKEVSLSIQTGDTKVRWAKHGVLKGHSNSSHSLKPKRLVLIRYYSGMKYDWEECIWCNISGILAFFFFLSC